MKKLFVLTMAGLICHATAFASTYEWTSGQLGGGWYTMASGLAKFIEENNADYKIKVVPGGGTSNPTKVDQGKSQFGMGLDVLAYLAMNGKDIYSGKPTENLKMNGGSLSDTLFHFVRADSATLTLEQIFQEAKDIKIGVTKAGSSDEKIFSWLMEYYGTSYEGLKKRGVRVNHANYSELSSQYKDKLVDYVFVNLGVPGAAVIDMLISRKGTVSPMPEEVMAKFKSSYGYQPGFIKAGTYQDQTEDVATGNMATIIIVNKTVDNDVVYNVTKTICENEDKLSSIHGSMASYKCETAVKNATLPVHPGALKYYKEMGYVK